MEIIGQREITLSLTCPQTQDLEICPPTMIQGEQPNNASMLCFTPVNLLCEVCAECDFVLFLGPPVAKISLSGKHFHTRARSL